MPLYHSEPLDNSFCYLQAKCFQLLKPRGYGHEKHRFISIIETKVQSAPVCTCCTVCNRTDVRGSQDFLRIVVGCSKNDIKTLGWHESMRNHRFQTAHIKVHSEKQTHFCVPTPSCGDCPDPHQQSLQPQQSWQDSWLKKHPEQCETCIKMWCSLVLHIPKIVSCDIKLWPRALKNVRDFSGVPLCQKRYRSISFQDRWQNKSRRYLVCSSRIWENRC